MCDCKQLLSLMRDQNLVTNRRVFSQRVNVAADALEGYADIELQPGKHTRAWAVRVLNLPTITDGTDTVVFVGFNGEGTPAEEFAKLLEASSDFIEPGAKHVQVMPVGVARVRVHVAGLSVDDLETQAAAAVVVEAWELTPNDLRECPTER